MSNTQPGHTTVGKFLLVDVGAIVLVDQALAIETVLAQALVLFDDVEMLFGRVLMHTLSVRRKGERISQILEYLNAIFTSIPRTFAFC